MGGCDKTVPALVMGATSANLPAMLMPAGPMLRGNWRGQFLGSGSDVWKYWAERRAGTLDECSWREMEDGIARSFGTCMTMGTASTMAAADRSARADASGRILDSCGRFGARAHGRRQRPPQRRDGLGRSHAARHSHDRSVRKLGHRRDGPRRFDQCHHSSDRARRTRGRAARSRSLRRAVAPHAVHRQHPPERQYPDGRFLLRGRLAGVLCRGSAICCTPTA